ncbi:hypothetical protein KDL45_06085, partial [bacterium]|nr:hypothetical protein [bacterium]
EYDTPNPIPPYPFDMHYKRYQIVVKEKRGGLFGSVYMPYDLDMDKPMPANMKDRDKHDAVASKAREDAIKEAKDSGRDVADED